MQAKEFDKLDELADMVNKKIHKLYEDGEFLEITKKIKEVTKVIEEAYSITVDFQVNAFDSKKEKSVRALTIGISSSGDQDPFLAYGDSTSERYLVNGNIKKVPHDFCPEYDIVMGEDVKILLDTDSRPNCAEGNVTLSKQKCDECGLGWSSCS